MTVHQAYHDRSMTVVYHNVAHVVHCHPRARGYTARTLKTVLEFTRRRANLNWLMTVDDRMARSKKRNAILIADMPGRAR